MRISTLNVVDYVNIVGHYNTVHNGPTIDPRLLERFKNKPEMIEQIKKQSASSGGTTSLNIKFSRPLESFRYELFGYIITLYRKYSELGILPFPGSLSDQPAQIIEVFNTLESVELEIKHQQQKKQNKELKRNKVGRGKR